MGTVLSKYFSAFLRSLDIVLKLILTHFQSLSLTENNFLRKFSIILRRHNYPIYLYNQGGGTLQVVVVLALAVVVILTLLVYVYIYT